MNQYRCETCKKRTTITCPIQDETVYYKIKEYVTVPTGWEILTSCIGCTSHSDFQSEREIIYQNVFRYPSRFPTIKARQLAYKDFEEGGESWCSLPDSPMLEDGDIIQIFREGKDGEQG